MHNKLLALLTEQFLNARDAVQRAERRALEEADESEFSQLSVDQFKLTERNDS